MRDRPIVTLTVDDCWRDHAQAFRNLFDSKGLTGVFYVITDFVGRRLNGFDFLDWNILSLMNREKGHEIGSHSRTHRPAGLNKVQKGLRLLHQAKNDGFPRSSKRLLSSISTKGEEYEVSHFSAEEEIRLSKREIETRLNTVCNSYSYPGGGYTSNLERLVKSSGYTTGRTGYSGFNSISQSDRFTLQVQTWDQVVSGNTANQWLDRSITNNHWLIEVFHALDLDGYAYSCNSKILANHLDYIRRRANEIENLTISEIP